MNEDKNLARDFLNSIGWDYYNTESAARMVAEKAQEIINEKDETIKLLTKALKFFKLDRNQVEFIKYLADDTK